MTDLIPDGAKPLYRDWMSLLVNRYLLAAPGKNHQDLIRAHYRKKSNYLLFCNQLNKTESTFNMALLPEIEGDPQDLRYILDRMEQGIEAIFSYRRRSF